MDTFNYRIADINLELTSPVTPDELGITDRYESFSAPYDPRYPTIRIRWEEGDPDRVPYGDAIFDPGTIWRMHKGKNDSTFVARIGYTRSTYGEKQKAVVVSSIEWDDVIVTELRVGPSWRSLLNIGVGELLFRARIIVEDGLLFHASGLDDNGRGILFVGHAGAGKSTQANLWNAERGVSVMNDDRMAVRFEGRGVTAYGTPWGGTADIARNHDVKLNALIILQQASENEIVAVPSGKAVPLLLTCCFLPYWDRVLTERAIETMEKMLHRVPVYLLRCRPEREVIPLVRSVL